MRNKTRNLAILILCIAMGLTASTSFAKENACGKEMSGEEMAAKMKRQGH